jgi:hypothetical protein
MDGIVLDRSEFLVLLDATQATAVVGLGQEDLFPKNTQEHRELLDQGVRKLQSRGLLEVRADNVRAIDELLLQVIAVVTRPQIAVITTRDTPGVGSQLFLHYQNGPYVVEQTLPEPGQHRLATIPTILALFDRLLDVFPVGDQDVSQSVAFSVPQDIFLQAKELTEQRQQSQAQAMLTQHGVQSEVSEAFLDDIAGPTFGGNIAMLRCEDQQITDGRNPAILYGSHGAWMIVPNASDPTVLDIGQTNATRLKEQFADWFKSLVPELFNQ